MKTDPKAKLKTDLIYEALANTLLPPGSKPIFSSNRIIWAIVLLMAAAGLMMLLSKRFGILF